MGEGERITSIHIDGCEIAGIPDFDADLEVVDDYFKNACKQNIQMCLDPQGEFKATVKIKWDVITFYKLIGLYNYICTYCPNKRVVHLIRYGKTRRVRLKNFKRGLHIVGMILEKYEEEK